MRLPIPPWLHRTGGLIPHAVENPKQPLLTASSRHHPSMLGTVNQKACFSLKPLAADR